jgi:hypothetical protein
MNWEPIIVYLTPIALGGLGSFLAFLAILPTKIGEKLLAHHFEAKLAALKHDHGIELGKLQAELDHLKDRGIRSNEREYQAITSVWEAFVDAFLATKRCVVQFMSFPDLTRLPIDDVMEFLTTQGFSEPNASRIASAENRNRAFGSAVRGRLINQAGDEVLKALALHQKQCVFVPHPLSAQFEAAIGWLNDARAEQYVAHGITDHGPLEVRRSMALIGAEGTQMFEDLRDAVRDRLLRALHEDKKADAEIRAD